MTDKEFQEKDMYFWRYINTVNDLDKALLYAEMCHSGQVRKHAKLSYLTHLVVVSRHIKSILQQLNMENEELEIAGLLHDTLEDTPLTMENLEMRFGSNVLNYVLTNTEDKSKTWKERKSTTIEKIKYTSLGGNILLLADKLSNLSDLLKHKIEVGDRAFDMLKEDKKAQKWYFESIGDELHKFFILNTHSTPKELKEYKDLVQTVFDKKD